VPIDTQELDSGSPILSERLGYSGSVPKQAMISRSDHQGALLPNVPRLSCGSGLPLKKAIQVGAL
jgi:hypothetical protein